MRIRSLPFVLLFLSLGVAGARASEPATFHRFGIGANYGGGQLDWRVTRKWTLEARVQGGRDSETKTRGNAVGARLYRYNDVERRMPLFWGVSAAHASASRSGTTYTAAGVSSGAFAGIGFRLASRLFLEVDAGPYFIYLKENRTNASSSSVEFVADTSLSFLFR